MNNKKTSECFGTHRKLIGYYWEDVKTFFAGIKQWFINLKYRKLRKFFMHRVNYVPQTEDRTRHGQAMEKSTFKVVEPVFYVNPALGYNEANEIRQCVRKTLDEVAEIRKNQNK